MSYAYGTRGLPTDINQLGGLPRRRGVAKPPDPNLPSDPHFSNVSLLLHGNSFTDSSPNPKNVVLNGNPQITTNGVFGGSAMYFASGADWLSVPTLPALGSGAFTIEMFVYLVAFNGRYTENAQISGTTSGNTIMMVHNGYGRIDLGVENTSWNLYSNTSAAQLGVWKHVAVVRSSSGVTTIFSDGKGVGSASWNPNFTGSGLKVNRRNDATGGTCYIQELRITNGIARYTENFTPPTEPFPDK